MSAPLCHDCPRRADCLIADAMTAPERCTYHQRAAEAEAAYARMAAARVDRARARMAVRRASDGVPTLAQVNDSGKTRDIVADKIGMSHGTYDKAKVLWGAALLAAVRAAVAAGRCG